jgi:DNA polymerase-1
LDDLKYELPDKEKLAALFYRLGFRSQIKKWNLEDVSPLEAAPEHRGLDDIFKIPLSLPEIKTNVSLVEFSKIMMSRVARDNKDFCLSIDMPMPQTHIDADMSADFSANLTVCFGPDQIFSFGPDSIRMVLEYLVRQGIGKKSNEFLPVGHSIKARFRSLPFSMPFASCFDVEIAGYILNQIEGGSPPFEMLYEHAVGESFPRFAAYSGPDLDNSHTSDKPMDILLAQSELSLVSSVREDAYNRQKLEESAWRALLCRKIAAFQRRQIADISIETLVYDIEMPLVLHLDQMERTGVLVDRETLEKIHISFESELNRLSASIYDKADMTFNILSPKQIGQVLFEKLKLPSGRKNSSGTYSTDSDELMRLIDEHPVVRDILNYRQISKLDSTFVLGLQKVIDSSDGRVHSSFSQAMTNTGRLSSADPNLQNIPIRSDLGSQIRKAFIAPPGRVLLDADYSQIELRLLAHLSGDENMMKAFLNNEDIHTNTAANIFGVPKEQVQPSMRAAAKTVNFSIVYGISDFGLSTDLGVSFQEAHHYIEHYYAQYPMIRAYLDSLKQMGYDKGYVETMFGRRRVVRELTSPNRNIRNFGERAAMNTPVQGTAADIIKIAMNRVSEGLVKEKLDAVLILQVHDELIVECREDQAAAASVVLKQAMEGAAVLRVPLIAEVSRGQNWYDCKMG